MTHINQIGFSQMPFYCGRVEIKSDSMNRAWYPYQIIDSFKIDSEALIVANTKIKPIDFISSIESMYNSPRPKYSKEFIENYETTEYKCYNEYLKSYRIDSLRDDSIAKREHIYANSLPMAIWIQNITKDTIIFPIQDGSLIAILEAQNKNKIWKPVQYWWYSWCGNSYSKLELPPNKSIQIGVNNLIGDKETMMRFLIQGKDTIYYSNEFKGTVSEDDFFLNAKTRQEKINDEYRISFLDSVRQGLTNDEEEYEMELTEPDE